MQIRLAEEKDLTFLSENDRHVKREELTEILRRKRITIAQEDDRPIGWLRWGLFWDAIPFMNMLYVLEGFRGKGTGRLLVEDWENRMRIAGYDNVMTSTLSDEQAQHFYRKLHFTDCGVLLMQGEAAELIFCRKL